MEKVDARDEGDNMTSDMEMVLIDRRGNERTRTIRVVHARTAAKTRCR